MAESDRLIQGYARALFSVAEALHDVTGKEIELRVLVDPSVIGGVVARVGDQVFDGTIRRKLQMAREQLVQAR